MSVQRMKIYKVISAVLLLISSSALFAMNDMNSALSGIPYKYERNTDGDTFPLKAVMR